MFRNISRLTASFFSQYTDEEMTPETLDSCLKEIQKGLDALFDDRIIQAEDTFATLAEKSNSRSSFYAYGYALFIYIKAMLSLDLTEIENVLAYLQDLESDIKKYTKKKAKSSDQDDLSLQFDLLHANIIYMSATLQFLNDSWIDSFKAAYDLRKAFKMYEKLFQIVCGVELEHDESDVDTTRKKQKFSRRVVSLNPNFSNSYMVTEETTPANTTQYNDTLRHGIYFGIGLFNIAFLLLPIKVRKVLTSLGFYSSRSTAVSLLEKIV